MMIKLSDADMSRIAQEKNLSLDQVREVEAFCRLSLDLEGEKWSRERLLEIVEASASREIKRKRKK